MGTCFLAATTMGLRQRPRLHCSRHGHTPRADRQGSLIERVFGCQGYYPRPRPSHGRPRAGRGDGDPLNGRARASTRTSSSRTRPMSSVGSPRRNARKRNPPATRRRALELLAGSRDGCTEAIMIAHGFSIEQIVDLVRVGLATATAERVVAGRFPMEFTRVRTTEAGRRALGGGAQL
jgi:hypothetical protein